MEKEREKISLWKEIGKIWISRKERMRNRLSGGYVTIKTESGEAEVFSFFEFTDRRLRLSSKKTGQLMEFYAEEPKEKRRK